MLIVRCCVFLLAGAAAQAGCGKDTKGSNRPKLELPIEPIKVDMEGSFVVDLYATNCNAVGAKVRACSNDSRPPKVRMQSVYRAIVTRQGAPRGPVTVSSSLYCKNNRLHPQSLPYAQAYQAKN